MLLAGGGIVVAVAATYWCAKVRRDPLSMVPERANRLLPAGMLVPVLMWMLVGILVAPEPEGGGGIGRPALLRFLTDNAAPVLGGLACVWVGAHCFQGGGRGFLLGDGRLIRPAVAGAGYMLASMAICPLVYEVTVAVFISVEPHYGFFHHEIIDRLRAGETPLWALWVGTAIIAPVAEECFFRGMIQTCLGNVLRSRWLAVVLAGAIFGAVHSGGGDNPQPHVVPALTVLGIMLGVLYVRTGSLVGPIVLHTLFNVKTLLWETLLHGGG